RRVAGRSRHRVVLAEPARVDVHIAGLDRTGLADQADRVAGERGDVGRPEVDALGYPDRDDLGQRSARLTVALTPQRPAGDQPGVRTATRRGDDDRRRMNVARAALLHQLEERRRVPE